MTVASQKGFSTQNCHYMLLAISYCQPNVCKRKEKRKYINTWESGVVIENGSHRLRYLNTCLPLIEFFWKGLEVRHCWKILSLKVGFEVSNPMPSPPPPHQLPVYQDVKLSPTASLPALCLPL